MFADVTSSCKDIAFAYYTAVNRCIVKPLTHSLQVTGKHRKLVTGNDVFSIEANPVASFPATLPFPLLIINIS